jgi:hypothetical protein
MGVKWGINGLLCKRKCSLESLLLVWSEPGGEQRTYLC